MHKLSPEQVDDFGRALNNKSLPLKARFRALFALRNVGDDKSVEWIGKCLDDQSALLKHELAYCLGQMQNKSAIPVLVKTLEDQQQEPMVRHEAGEALGAIADPSVLDILLKYSKDASLEVAETCILALKRVEYVNNCGDLTKSPYDSIDPTPSSSIQDVNELKKMMCDSSRPLWDRYKAMFTLRNINTDESISALASGLFCEDSALFRHEVAYVLGQVQSAVAIGELKARLLLSSENCMVRHECAEALGAIATDECTEILQEYAKDEERVVRESCEVALDMADYENSEQFQYAKMRGRLVRIVQLAHNPPLRSYSSCQASFPYFSHEDIGKLYETKKEHYDQLTFSKNLPSTMRKQSETLSECVSMVRQPLVEVCSWLQTSSPSLPSLRVVLWGRFGTGKSMTLHQASQVAVEKGWVVVYLRTAMELTRKVAEVDMSTYCPGRINDAVKATAILNDFKTHNSHVWKKLSELKTTRAYEWTKKEQTEEGKAITEMVEMGISAPFLATDCVGGLFRELRHHASRGDVNLLVAIDDANSLWGKTLVKRADRKYAEAADLSLVQHYRRLIKNDWNNGCVLLVADPKEKKDARDRITVPRHTPLELFGLDGFQAIEPFVPVETTLYKEKEIKAMHEYFVEKRWINSKEAKSDEGFAQLKHISAFNPYNFERLCAFI